eukprot:gene2475-2849_t
MLIIIISPRALLYASAGSLREVQSLPKKRRVSSNSARKKKTDKDSDEPAPKHRRRSRKRSENASEALDDDLDEEQRKAEEKEARIKERLQRILMEKKEKEKLKELEKKKKQEEKRKSKGNKQEKRKSTKKDVEIDEEKELETEVREEAEKQRKEIEARLAYERLALESEEISTQERLEELNERLKLSLSLANPDPLKCTKTLQEISELRITPDVIKHSRNIVQTLKKVRCYKGNPKVSLKAATLYSHLKSQFVLAGSGASAQLLCPPARPILEAQAKKAETVASYTVGESVVTDEVIAEKPLAQDEAGNATEVVGGNEADDVSNARQSCQQEPETCLQDGVVANGKESTHEPEIEADKQADREAVEHPDKDATKEAEAEENETETDIEMKPAGTNHADDCKSPVAIPMMAPNDASDQVNQTDGTKLDTEHPMHTDNAGNEDGVNKSEKGGNDVTNVRDHLKDNGKCEDNDDDVTRPLQNKNMATPITGSGEATTDGSDVTSVTTAEETTSVTSTGSDANGLKCDVVKESSGVPDSNSAENNVSAPGI